MTARTLVLYDDARARAFAPFSLTRPAATLRAGAEVIWRRWAHALGADRVLFASSPHLTSFAEGDALRSASGILAEGTILANARCVPRLWATADADAAWWKAGDAVAAVRLGMALPTETLADGTLDLSALVGKAARSADVDGRWLNAVWDLVAQLPDQLDEDTRAIAARRTNSGAAGERIGEHAVVIDDGAVVEPFVTFDARTGAIVVDAGAHIESFTRIAGPCVIGAHTRVHGGRVNGCFIGPHCRVHGDVSTSIFIGHANKAHEGFVGHSVVGQWANLGAGTTTSNLKNSYGAVRLWTPHGERDTGLAFLGSLIGDHAKLGIGTMLGTGTVVGAGANVFGTMRPPKYVPPFAWGDAPPYQTFSLEKFLEVAARVMDRRGVALDAKQRALLSRAHALADTGEW